MSGKEYPFTAWTLTPGFKPVETVFVEPYKSWDGTVYEVSAKGATYPLFNIFESKEQAVIVGLERLKEQQKAIDKKQENLNKRKSTLEKNSLV